MISQNINGINWSLRRYWVFVGNHYSPLGGMLDFRSCFDTIDECQSCIEDWIKDQHDYDENDDDKERWMNHYAHIYDMKSFEIVWKKNC